MQKCAVTGIRKPVPGIVKDIEGRGLEIHCWCGSVWMRMGTEWDVSRTRSVEKCSAAAVGGALGWRILAGGFDLALHGGVKLLFVL